VPSTETARPAGEVAIVIATGGAFVKLAVTVRGPSMTTVCGLAPPLKSPLQPANT
jgi:hypothetical protein